MLAQQLVEHLLTPQGAASALVGLLAFYYILPYLQTWRLRDIPTPSFAAFTNLWLLLQARQGRRFEAVHEAHQKHGKLVRIAPRHVSIADDAAINAIYGHGNGFLKAYVDLVYLSIYPPSLHVPLPFSHRFIYAIRIRIENVKLTSTVTSMMPSSPSVAVCSTPVIVRSTRASARRSRTPSV